MHNGVSAAVSAMEQAVRRLDAALARRAAAFRSLAEQHGATVAELRDLREQLQASRAEADALRERADLVDALRAELAQMQQEAEAAPVAVRPDTERRAASRHDAEVADLTDGLQALRSELVALGGDPAAAAAAGEAALRETVAVRDAEIAALKAECEALRQSAAPAAAASPDVTALKAELAAARAAQAEMQAFQSGIAARLEATMARLRQALDAEAAGS